MHTLPCCLHGSGGSSRKERGWAEVLHRLRKMVATLRKYPLCVAALLLVGLLCSTLATGGRYSWAGSEEAFAAQWRARYAGLLALPRAPPVEVIQAAPHHAWRSSPPVGAQDGHICAGILSDRREDPYVYRTLESLVTKRAAKELPLSLVLFATPPDGSVETVAAAAAPGSHSSDRLAAAGYTVVRMDQAFPPDLTAPQRYGHALQWMAQHDQVECSVFLMLEDDGYAAAAWDVALMAALGRLQAHDGLWLWLKLMMPDNYAGWASTPSSMALLLGPPLLLALLVWALLVKTGTGLGHATATSALVAGGVALLLHAAGRQHLPSPVNRMAHLGLQRYSQPCCIVAQAYNPATVSLLAPCLAQAAVERHADMALMPCLQRTATLAQHTYLLLPDLFQHIGVRSSKNCTVVGQNCYALRVAGQFLDERLAGQAREEGLRQAAVQGLGGGAWSHAALMLAREQVETWMGGWLASLPPAPALEEY